MRCPGQQTGAYPQLRAGSPAVCRGSKGAPEIKLPLALGGLEQVTCSQPQRPLSQGPGPPGAFTLLWEPARWLRYPGLFGHVSSGEQQVREQESPGNSLNSLNLHLLNHGGTTLVAQLRSPAARVWALPAGVGRVGRAGWGRAAPLPVPPRNSPGGEEEEGGR